MIRPPPISTLFPYTTLFRSAESKQIEVGIRPEKICAIGEDHQVAIGPGHERINIGGAAVHLGDGQRRRLVAARAAARSEEHTSELQSRLHLVCRLLLEKKKY